MKKLKNIHIIAPLLSAIFCLLGVVVIPQKAFSVGAEREKLRETIIRSLGEFIVQTPTGEYVFSYPEINFTDNYSAYKKGESYRVKYYLCQAEERLEKIVADNSSPCLDASVFFDENGFSYEYGQTGFSCDIEQLKADVYHALENPFNEGDKISFEKVGLYREERRPKVTVETLKKRTQKLAAYTTYFQENDEGRCKNISLAVGKIDGKTIMPNEKFSFNETVGARTAENGFQKAKIIQNGEFIQGVGGGVCQVSTTLYNAVLLSGLKVEKVRAHSLAVSYVPPSRDAMVSSHSDFVFSNPFSFPVYLSAKSKNGWIRVTFYGKTDGKTYKITSNILKEIPPEKPIEKIGEEDRILRNEKSGIKSESYLEVYQAGALIARKRLRVDEYAPVRGIIAKKTLKPTKKIG